MSHECYRPAPGHEATCSQLTRSRQFEERQAEWMREWRKIYARKSRGVVTEKAWRDWQRAIDKRRQEQEDPSAWVPFDEWRGAKKT